MEQISQQYHHPMVRHLAWCLFSPNLGLIQRYPPMDVGAPHTITQWLNRLDDNPTELERYVQSRNHQLLGSYFECLWQFFFTYGPNWQLLKDHVQIHATTGKQQTLGELDVLTEDHQGNAWHVELAVKFYLQLPATDGRSTNHWVGPQTRDRLDLKLSKLENKQFPFLDSEETQAHLSDLSLQRDWQQGLILKGYLFTKRGQEVTLPTDVPKDVLLNIWCPIQELGLTIPRHSYFVLLPKHEWLGPYFGLHIEVLDFQTVIKQAKQHFEASSNKHALMIAKVEKEKDNWKEKNRWLVVHNDWPNPIKA